ncbi:MAG: type II toxin-antitoxin system RelE/ParE family toxin [Acidobacteriota bacterium]
MIAESGWKIDVYRTEKGTAPLWDFFERLTGRDKTEAIALVKLLEEQGNRLRRPQSGVLGQGLLELRGRQVSIFYMFLPGRVVVLLDGEIKKRDSVAARTLARVRRYQPEVLRRHLTRSGEGDL